MTCRAKAFRIGVLCLLGFTLLACQARAEWQVGATADTVRVLRSDPVPAATRSFQVFTRSDAPVAGVRLAAGDLRGPDGAVIPAGACELFREHLIDLVVGTYRNDKFKPDGYPDPLIPAKNPMTGRPIEKARLLAMPFDLPAGETHGFWIDVNVPADAKPGQYRGTFRLAGAGGQAAEVPVTLTVWNFALPRVASMQTEFGSPAGRIRGYYKERAKAGTEPDWSDWPAVEAQCAELVTRHRINATPPSGTFLPREQGDGSYAVPADQVAAMRAFVDRYQVNAFCVPNPSSLFKDPEKGREKLRAWLKAYDKAAAELDRPGVLLFTYLKDEPNDEEAYRFVQQWGKAIRDAKSVVKVLVVEQTWTQDPKWGDLYGAVDIWCPLFSLHKQENAATRQALGELVWTYTALCQGQPTPWWHIDWPLLNYRVPAWTAWRYRMRGLLYWGGMTFWKEVEDPWLDGRTYGHAHLKNGKGPLYNGEGTLVYPARAAGYDGIVASLRLKALRDSINDYEYMMILEKAGLAAEAQRIVEPLAGSFFEWEKNPAAYEAARARLAALIVATPAK
jgi:hypothetical protein